MPRLRRWRLAVPKPAFVVKLLGVGGVAGQAQAADVFF